MQTGGYTKYETIEGGRRSNNPKQVVGVENSKQMFHGPRKNQHQNPSEIVATQIAGLETPKDVKRCTEVVGMEGNMKV